MEALKIQFNGSRSRRGSAMVLVIVVTVLLASIGALFILMARIDDMASSSAVDNRDLNAGVNAVVERINEQLAEDLFDIYDMGNPFRHLLASPTFFDPVTGMLNRPGYGTVSGYNEPYDSPEMDPWLASVEPVVPTPATGFNDDTEWPYISSLWWLDVPFVGADWYDPDDRNDPRQWDGTSTSDPYRVSLDKTYRTIFARIIDPRQTTQIIRENGDWGNPDHVCDFGARADADGDGVADSRWIPIPSMQTSRGKKIYTAVRVVDNNAMFNLNVAHTLTDTDTGKYLSEQDYIPFLRGNDVAFPGNIRLARDGGLVSDTPELWHNDVLMNVESPGADYTLFDIGDELEIRNRFMLTSNAISWFEAEGVAYDTFDLGRGNWGPSGAFWSTKSKRVPAADLPSFAIWKDKLRHEYFDDITPIDYEYMYDRRHVCTFYSFDRNIRRRQFPFVDPAAIAPDSTEDKGKMDTILALAPGVFAPVAGAPDIRDISEGTIDARKKILHLLYGFRAYFIDAGDDYKTAARKSAQVVANMIDYTDYANSGDTHPFNYWLSPEYGDQKPEDVTYIDGIVVRQLIKEVSEDILGFAYRIDIDEDDDADDSPFSIGVVTLTMGQFDFGLDETDVVYGLERQPFISELYVLGNSAATEKFAVELLNPYDAPIDLTGWKLRVGGTEYDLDANPNELIVDAASGSALSPGRNIVWNTEPAISSPYIWTSSDMKSTLIGSPVIELMRPVGAADYIVVDRTLPEQMDDLFTQLDSVSAPDLKGFSSKRDDTSWRFANNQAFSKTDFTTTINLADPNNNVTLSSFDAYQLPIADSEDQWGTLTDFVRVAWIGNDEDLSDPDGCITAQIPVATDEGDIRYDIKESSSLMEYISLLNRDNGRLPGRININTATKEVLRAAIPPAANGTDWIPDDVAQAIIDQRNQIIPTDPSKHVVFMNLTELTTLPQTSVEFATYANDPNENAGDPTIADDFEERDWLLSLVYNKFTVRSDVFTAYILVRVGIDGPEKRMIAIFDRSEVYNPQDRPRLVALHPVPDPR